jgi:ornithine carbamoyltransferase
MYRTPNPNPMLTEAMSPREADALLTKARALKRAAQLGKIQPLLRGKNVGLLSETRDGDAALFHHAASELGAHVAHIHPKLSDLSSAQEIQHTARMLGRLYDAVECQGMLSSLVQQVSDEAGVPVYDGIASLGHPTARLAEQLGGDMSTADNRRFVVQAVLLSTIG